MAFSLRWRPDKADLWEDVEAGLESINPIRPRGKNRSIRLIPLPKTSCLRRSCNLKAIPDLSCDSIDS